MDHARPPGSASPLTAVRLMDGRSRELGRAAAGQVGGGSRRGRGRPLICSRRGQQQVRFGAQWQQVSSGEHSGRRYKQRLLRRSDAVQPTLGQWVAAGGGGVDKQQSRRRHRQCAKMPKCRASLGEHAGLHGCSPANRSSSRTRIPTHTHTLAITHTPTHTPPEAPRSATLRLTSPSTSPPSSPRFRVFLLLPPPGSAPSTTSSHCSGWLLPDTYPCLRANRQSLHALYAKSQPPNGRLGLARSQLTPGSHLARTTLRLLNKTSYVGRTPTAASCNTCPREPPRIIPGSPCCRHPILPHRLFAWV